MSLLHSPAHSGLIVMLHCVESPSHQIELKSEHGDATPYG